MPSIPSINSINSIIEQLLVQYKIPRTRYLEELKQLKNAGFSAEEANKLILRKSSSTTVRSVLSHYQKLMKAPYHLTHAQIIPLASHDGGSMNIMAFLKHQRHLIALGFSAEQIIHMVSHRGGSKYITAALMYTGNLRSSGLSFEQIVRIILHRDGPKNLKSALSQVDNLKTNGFEMDQIIHIIPHEGGSTRFHQEFEQLQDAGFSFEEAKKLIIRPLKKLRN